jgi:hypothetical protein
MSAPGQAGAIQPVQVLPSKGGVRLVASVGAAKLAADPAEESSRCCSYIWRREG